MFQFSNNLIRVKKLAVEWAKDRQKANQKDLKDVEVALETLFYQNSSGVFSEEEFKQLKDLENKESFVGIKGDQMDAQKSSYLAIGGR
jgi:hypothetical protein